jgi:hypothetical protein
LAANTVGGGNIIAGSITATQIAAGTITATQIAAGTITADKLAANVFSVGNIVSFNATLGDFNSPGYWLQYTTGDVRFGGNVSIGANLNVTGLINGSVLSPNTVSRNNFIPGTLPGSTGVGTVPSSILVGPGTANWDGLDSSSATNIYWKTVGYYEFTFPQNVPPASTVGYSINFTADVVGINLSASATSGFPGLLFGYNGINRPNDTTYKAAGPGTVAIYNKNWWGATSINEKAGVGFQWVTNSTNWSATGKNYIEVWLTSTPSALATNGTISLTNINFTVTPL